MLYCVMARLTLQSSLGVWFLVSASISCFHLAVQTCLLCVLNICYKSVAFMALLLSTIQYTPVVKPILGAGTFLFAHISNLICIQDAVTLLPETERWIRGETAGEG